jgi:hypothetical protein
MIRRQFPGGEQVSRSGRHVDPEISEFWLGRSPTTPGAQALRTALMDTMRDPEFLAEAARAKLEITLVSDEKVEELVARLYRTRSEIAAKAGAGGAIRLNMR